MIKKDYLKEEIKLMYNEFGSNLYLKCAEEITDILNDTNDLNSKTINLSELERGKFYFIFYDLQGKSSNMEKFNPIFVIDWTDNKKYIYGVSINFIPVSVRTVFFNNLFNYNLDVVEKNMDLKIENQLPIKSINFELIYNMLYKIGFEWSIRKFESPLINKVNVISTNILATFISMSTAKFTGVNDLKLVEIWHKKIKEQDVRHKKIIAELLSDYTKMNSELTIQYNSVMTKENNLDNSLKLINKLFK